MNWVAMFSQTGSEIISLSKRIGKKPDLLMTNNFEKDIKINPELRKLGVTIMYGKHDMLMDYLKLQKVMRREETLITLHGYLRILPADVCDLYEIYNGHPGAIDLYPELKGKDPQEKVWNEKEKYNIIGSVVHKCIPELDAGDIMRSVHVSNKAESKDALYTALKETSLTAWVNFMKEKRV